MLDEQQPHTEDTDEITFASGNDPLSIARLTGNRPPIVLTPFPGAETFGCGALLAASFAGPGARVISVTDGTDNSDGSTTSFGLLRKRRRRGELESAIRALGGSRHDIDLFGLPVCQLPMTGPVLDRSIDWVVALCRFLDARCLYSIVPNATRCDTDATALLAQHVAARLPQVRLLYYAVESSLQTLHDDCLLSDTVAEDTFYQFDPEHWSIAKARAVSCYRRRRWPFARMSDPQTSLCTAASVLPDECEWYVETRRFHTLND